MTSLITILLLAATAASPADTTVAPWFAFSYEDGWGTQLDTYRGTLTKDPAIKTISFALSETDLDSLRQEAIAVRILEIPEPHPDFKDCSWSQIKPVARPHLIISLGSEKREFSWSARIGCESGEWTRLLEFQALMWRIINRQPEYRSLPVGSGRFM